MLLEKAKHLVNSLHFFRSFIVLLPLVIFMSSSVKSFDLKCKYENAYSNMLGYLLSCQVETSFDLTNRSESEITSVNGVATPTDVKMLFFSSPTFGFIPKGIDKLFPRLQVLKFIESSLESIKQEDLKSLKNLYELDLGSNKLTILEEELFKFNTELRYIRFDNNQLEFVEADILKPLKNLDKAHFRNCRCINDYGSKASIESTLNSRCPSPNRLKEIFCSKDIQALHEKISDLEKQLATTKALYESCDANLDSASFVYSSTSKQLKACSNLSVLLPDPENISMVRLNCEFNREDRTCVPENFNIRQRNSMILELAFETRLIRNLTVVNKQTIFLPLNFHEMVPNLIELNVINSGLFEIDQKALDNLFELISLSLSKNKLTGIPTDVFTDLKKLKRLDLSLNNIQDLENGAFKNLVNLETLSINGNSLINIRVEAFEDLENIKELALQDNKLKFISANLLTYFPSIKLLALTNNDCITISYPEETKDALEERIIDNCVAPIELKCKLDQVLDGLTCRAQELTINYPKNKISKLIGVNSNHSITDLIIVRQSIEFLPFKLAQVMPNLKKIFIERSKLTSIQKNDFEGLSKLNSIEIRHNNLSTIQEGSFDDIIQLELLDLSFNNIQSLPSKIFLRLVHLKTLILSNNQLEKFLADLLPRKNAIEEFRINNNQLEIIETKTLRFLRKAKLIDLKSNVCIDVKFDKNEQGSKGLVELSGKINLNCFVDD